jgi:hypothetical protein
MTENVSDLVLEGNAIHAAPMGGFLRCRRCDGILMRVVHTRHGRWLEMKGARYLRFSSST